MTFILITTFAAIALATLFTQELRTPDANY